MKYLILLVLVLVFFLIYKRLNFRKNIEKKEIKEPNVSFINVKKSDYKEKVITEENTPYDFFISSITKKDNTLELLVSIRNHTEKTVRINLLETIYFSTDLRQVFTADITFYGELNMGTNDILLKNTILPNSHVIRNIYFFEHDFLVFDEKDYVEIILEVNQKKYKFKQTLLESNLDSIKFIQKS